MELGRLIEALWDCAADRHPAATAQGLQTH
jgi:hypothetical protein